METFKTISRDLGHFTSREALSLFISSSNNPDSPIVKTDKELVDKANNLLDDL